MHFEYILHFGLDKKMSCCNDSPQPECHKKSVRLCKPGVDKNLVCITKACIIPLWVCLPACDFFQQLGKF